MEWKMTTKKLMCTLGGAVMAVTVLCGLVLTFMAVVFNTVA
jgi:hypothetical protein